MPRWFSEQERITFRTTASLFLFSAEAARTGGTPEQAGKLHFPAMSLVTTTYLEMRSAAELRPKPAGDARFWVRECTVPQWQFNRFLYFTVGGPWAWNDKRPWTDEQWRRYAESDRLRTFAGYYDGSPAGYYELHRGDGDAIEIAYFGLLPAFVGRGLGGALLTSALQEAWKANPPRVWVHTCTLDHPAALANYKARGMQVFKVETHAASKSSPEGNSPST